MENKDSSCVNNVKNSSEQQKVVNQKQSTSFNDIHGGSEKPILPEGIAIKNNRAKRGIVQVHIKREIIIEIISKDSNGHPHRRVVRRNKVTRRLGLWQCS